MNNEFGIVGVVGTGGGFRGASLPGFIEELLERGTPIHYFGSVSVSSLEFAKLSEAQNQEELPMLLKEVNAIWNYIEKEGPEYVFPYSLKKDVVRLWKGHALLENNTLFRLLKHFDPLKSIASPIRFEWSVLRDSDKAHCVLSNHDALFRNHPEFLIPSIVSSASTVPVFDTVKVGDDYYDDGGFAVVSRAMQYGCDTIFLLCLWPEQYRKSLPPKGFISNHIRILERLRSYVAAYLRKINDYEIGIIELHNEIAERDKHIAFLEQEIESLKTEIDELSERGGWVDKLLHHINALKDAFSSLPDEKTHVRKRVKKVNLIEVYADPPDTLTLDEFAPGDIALARKRAKEIMRKKLDEISHKGD